MTKQKKYLFKRRTDWLGRIFEKFGLAPRQKNIPVIGIHAAGKSYFLTSLGYFISRRELGWVVGETADYIQQFVKVMIEGGRLDATTGYREITLQVTQIYQEDYDQICREVPEAVSTFGERVWVRPQSVTEPPAAYRQDAVVEQQRGGVTIACDFLLSTYDLSGTQFKDAMEGLSEPSRNQGGDPQTLQFINALQNGEGVIVIVDVARRILSGEEFERERVKHIRAALAEQVVPLVKGIQLTITKRKLTNKVFPLFLVFTKRDIHQLSREQLDAIVKDVFAILIAGLERQIEIRIHSVQSMGFEVDVDSTDELRLESQSAGLGLFLADLYFWIREM